MERKILICGGGTAGHVYPAAAIMEYIKNYYPDSRLLFIGTSGGIEDRYIAGMGIDFEAVKACGLNLEHGFFKKILHFLKFLFLLAQGFIKSIKVIVRFKPDIILGMGGYVCGPVLMAAILLRKDYAIHEQNYIPGRLNNFFSRFAEYIFTSFEETEKFFNLKKSKIIFTGDPVREVIRNLKAKKPDYKKWGLSEERFSIVAFGGSLGAEKINNTAIELCNYFKENKEIQVLLICGTRFYNKLKGKMSYTAEDVKKDGLIFRVFPYIDKMDEIYRIADIIISRAGANTIAELIVSNIPAILIPYPLAVNNHQYYNANFLADSGKAFLILDEDLNANILTDKITELMKDDRKKYKEMKEIEIRVKKTDGAKIISRILAGAEN